MGGLSVLRHLLAQLPGERFLYVADQAHVPYDSRSQDEIQQLSSATTRFLRSQEAKLIVLACNTASAAALTHLRQPRRVLQQHDLLSQDGAPDEDMRAFTTGTASRLADFARQLLPSPVMVETAVWQNGRLSTAQ